MKLSVRIQTIGAEFLCVSRQLTSACKRVPVREVFCRTVSGLALCVGLVAHGAFAETSCASFDNEISVNTVQASAGFFANLRNAEHSITFRMDQLLAQARTIAQELSSKGPHCKRTCAVPAVAVIFRSKPRVYREGYDGAAACEALEQITKKTPIVYRSRRFSSEEEAREWYNDLTQGDGADGEDLYQRCPGVCSPSYDSQIHREGDTLIVSTSVVCGHARDKNDDHYILSAAVRWICR